MASNQVADYSSDSEPLVASSGPILRVMGQPPIPTFVHIIAQLAQGSIKTVGAKLAGNLLGSLGAQCVFLPGVPCTGFLRRVPAKG